MAPCDENFYSCSDCSRIFINQTTLQFHLKAHQEEKLIALVNRRRPVILLHDIANRIRTAQGINSDEESLPYVKPAPKSRSHLHRHHQSNTPRSHIREQRNKGVVRQFAVFGRVEDKGKARVVSRNQWGMHKCLQCGIIFNKEINLRLHKIKRHNTKSFSCRVCGKKFLSKIRLESHQSSHPDFYSKNQAMPELEYNNGSDFNNSSSSASQPPELNPEGESSQTSCDTGDPEGDAYETCLTCGDAISGPDLLIHINTHIQPGQTDCLHCDFEASHPKDLLDHMTVHYGVKTYACMIKNCGKAYHWKHSLARHMANSHASVSVFQCSSCDASFGTLREERRHALTHVTDGEAMSTTDTVVAAMSDDGDADRKKERPRPYACEQCEARFTKKKFLKAHEAIHSRRSSEYHPKPSFIGMRRIQHQPVYTKPRRKKNNESSSALLDSDKRACKTCGEEMLLSDLLVHIRTHVSKDQRQCELCQHVYANVESLREHMHTHYGLEPHKCTICHKTYSLKQSVLNHIIRNHKAAKPLEYYTCMIPATPKALREAAAVVLTPKKVKNGKFNGTSGSTPSNHVTSTTPSSLSSYGVSSNASSSVLASHFGVPQHVQAHSSHHHHSPLSSRSGTPSSSTNGDQNGFSKKSLKPVNFQCNFCSRVFTTKFSVQRHEAKLHNYVETDHKRHYKTTYATAEDSCDAYAMDTQGDTEHSWADGKMDTGSGHTNGDTNGEVKYESLRSEIRNLLLLQEHRNHEQFFFKEIPASLY